MKKPNPLYMFVVLLSLSVAGFAIFMAFEGIEGFSFLFPILMILGFVAFVMRVSRLLNNAQFEERLKIRTTCYSCKEEISADSEFCPKCGVNLVDEIECDYCGHFNPVDVEVCSECKAILK